MTCVSGQKIDVSTHINRQFFAFKLEYRINLLKLRTSEKEPSFGGMYLIDRVKFALNLATATSLDDLHGIQNDFPHFNESESGHASESHFAATRFR